MSMKICAVIPSHNHYKSLAQVIMALRGHGLPVLIVDDGSASPAREAIAACHDPAHGIEVVRLDKNSGKGGAVAHGLRLAAERGFTHAVQVDADGQHDLTAIDRLVEAARKNPEALVSGLPVYDSTMPLSRRFSRWLTHVWVWVETLSTAIRDSMCGFRVYPVAQTLGVLDTESVGKRMDFDTEIMVRLAWRGAPVIHVPVAVTYPEGNTSNFHLWRDNWLITKMHTRLVFGMLARLPSVWRNRPRKEGAPAAHWASMGERGAQFGLWFVLTFYRMFGRRACVLVLWPIVTYFFLTSGARRDYSLAYLRRIHTLKGLAAPGWRDSHAHFMSFAKKALDAVAAWSAPNNAPPIDIETSERVRELARDGGALLVVSHLGNAELCRAHLAGLVGRDVYALMHTRHARFYNNLIRSIRPDAADSVIEVSDLDPATMISLSERIEKGDWLAIAGDRIPLSGDQHTSLVPFLGDPAPFSHGPYILAALLGCPVVLMFCLKQGDRHVAIFEEFADHVVLPRGERLAAITDYASRYARRLEHHCLNQPLQWYNFYNFWNKAPPHN